jgi:regulator of ribosome biosynthesis
MSIDEMQIDSEVAAGSKPRLPVTVNKPIPYTFDLGNLLCNDSNPLPAVSQIQETDIKNAARDCAQALINQLLSTCPITKSDDSTSVTLGLPTPTTHLPREKRVPEEKQMTKWQEFAKKKGIKDKKRDGKLVYDEASGEWLPKYGYKGKDGGEHDARKERREERVERVKRNERRERANERRNQEKKS